MILCNNKHLLFAIDPFISTRDWYLPKIHVCFCSGINVFLGLLCFGCDITIDWHEPTDRRA